MYSCKQCEAKIAFQQKSRILKRFAWSFTKLTENELIFNEF